MNAIIDDMLAIVAAASVTGPRVVDIRWMERLRGLGNEMRKHIHARWGSHLNEFKDVESSEQQTILI